MAETYQEYAKAKGFGAQYAAGEQFQSRMNDEQYADRNMAAYKEAFGKLAPPQLQPGLKQQQGAEGQLWQGLAQQQQLGQAQAARRGFSATMARAAGQAGAEMESAGYGQAQQIRAEEEARRRQMMAALAQQQTGAMTQQDALATQRIQDRAAQYGFEQQVAGQLEAGDDAFLEQIGLGFLNLVGTGGGVAAGLVASDENLKKNIADGGAEADRRLAALSDALPLPEDADIRGGSFYKQDGGTMAVYMPRPGAVFEAKSSKSTQPTASTAKEEAMPNVKPESEAFYDELLSADEARRRMGFEAPTRGVAIQSIGEGGPSREMMDERAGARVVEAPRVAIIPSGGSIRPVAMADGRPLLRESVAPMIVAPVRASGPSLEPDYETLAAAVSRGRENPQVERGLRMARDTFDAERALMRRAREQRRARLAGQDVVMEPMVITGRAPAQAEAVRSYARQPRVADQALRSLRPSMFEYRDEALRAGEPDGRQLGVMAQDVQKGPMRDVVTETPIGKGIRTGDELLYEMLPLIGRVDQRLRKVEGKSVPAKSQPAREEPSMYRFDREAKGGR